MRIVARLIIAIGALVPVAFAQAQASSGTPLRVVIAGLVHGHASGFFEHYQHRPDLQIVGIAEPDQQLAAQYVQRFGLEQKLFYSDLEDAIQKTPPEAALAHTNTYDHRRVVEICARHGAR